MTLAESVAAYGYPLVFLGAIAEGETVLVAAGYLVQRHHLGFAAAVACAALGGMLGDQTYFALGRRFGDGLLARLPRRLGANVSRARALVQRNPVRVLLVMRFAYGMRILLPILCGMSAMKLSRYVRYNVGTAFVWAALFVGLGVAFGAAASAMIHRAARYEPLLLLAIVATLWMIHRAVRWARERRENRPA